MKGRTMSTTLKKMLNALHNDQRGAGMVEYVLIIAGVALPLLAVIIWFWGEIKDWVMEQLGIVKDQAGEAGQVG